MKKIITSMWLWKTSLILDYINWKWIYLVCFSQDEVQRVWKIILDEKLNIPMPIKLGEKCYNQTLFIDNADIMIMKIDKRYFDFNQVGSDFIIDVWETFRNYYHETWNVVEWYSISII